MHSALAFIQTHKTRLLNQTPTLFLTRASSTPLCRVGHLPSHTLPVVLLLTFDSGSVCRADASNARNAERTHHLQNKFELDSVESIYLNVYKYLCSVFGRSAMIYGKTISRINTHGSHKRHLIPSCTCVSFVFLNKKKTCFKVTDYGKP